MRGQVFAASGTPPMMIIRNHLNSESYVAMLTENLLPEAPLITDGDYFNKTM